MKIIFFGTPNFAVPILKRILSSNHKVIAVITQPDRPRGRGKRISESPIKQLAKTNNIPVLQPQKIKERVFLETLTQLKPDLGIVAAYGKMLPEQVLTLPKFGLINAHASLLPKYRGAAPIQRAVMAGEKETGISVIKLVKEMDAGPILKLKKILIDQKETSTLIEQRLAELASSLIAETVSELENNKISEKEQDHDRATFAPRLTKEDGLINWSASAMTIHNKIRGLHPWPHGFTYLKKIRYILHRTIVADVILRNVDGHKPKPGEIIKATGDCLMIAAGKNTALKILEIQPEGGRVLSSRAFLAGHNIKTGLSFNINPL